MENDEIHFVILYFLSPSVHQWTAISWERTVEWVVLFPPPPPTPRSHYELPRLLHAVEWSIGRHFLIQCSSYGIFGYCHMQRVCERKRKLLNVHVLVSHAVENEGHNSCQIMTSIEFFYLLATWRGSDQNQEERGGLNHFWCTVTFVICQDACAVPIAMKQVSVLTTASFWR